MTTFSRRLFTVAAGLAFMSTGAIVANAQYYTTYYAPTTAYYTPSTAYYTPTTAYYAPTTAYYAPTTAAYMPTTAHYGGGWYPGYWLDRMRTRMFGRTAYVAAAPVAAVAAYPATYSAGYAPTYASYAPSSCQSCQSNYMASYAPAPASYAPACSTCTASYAPACPCETCAPACESCSAHAPTQAGYAPQQSTGCSSCGHDQQSNYGASGAYASQPVGAPSGSPIIAAPGATVVQQNAAPAGTTADQRPRLEGNTGSTGNTNVPQSTYRSERPSEATPPASGPTPEPRSENPYKVPSTTKTSENSTSLEAPKLWDPRDRTAQRSIAPVHTALYKQPASFRQISTPVTRGPVSDKQAEQNAIGWTSASN